VNKYRSDFWSDPRDGLHVLTCPNGKQYTLTWESDEWFLSDPYGSRFGVGSRIGTAKDTAELRANDQGNLPV